MNRLERTLVTTVAANAGFIFFLVFVAVIWGLTS